MKIVIPDGHTLNPGDLDWSPLQAFGETIVYDRTLPSQVIERCEPAEIILTNKVKLGAEQLNSLPKLRYIGVTATGYNIIDLEAARKNQITVCNVPIYGTEAVAQHTFALILELSNHVGLHHQSVQAGDWSANRDWCYWKSPLVELSGKTIGIVGMGRIGQKVARIAQAFGMQILYHSRTKKDLTWAQFVGLEGLFTQSDVISLHLPLSEENYGFVNHRLLGLMKPSALLINTARGQLIQEPDLAEALNHNQIAGAGLDVLSQEPPPADHPLLKARGVIVSPHNAWCAYEARERLLQISVANVQAFLEGKAQNVVS